MPTIELTGNLQQDHRPITIGGESFEIIVCCPAVADRFIDSDLAGRNDGAWYEHRLKSTIKGWRGLLSPPGNEIPWTWETMLSLCNQYPEVYPQLMNAAHEAYRGLDAEAKKN